MDVAIKIAHPGSLRKFGYKMNKPQKSRRIALGKAAKAYGSDKVIKKLTALQVFNKNKAPKKSAEAKSDAQFIRKKKKM